MTLSKDVINRFLVECPPTPIYQRIARGYRDGLETCQQVVFFFDPLTYENLDVALDALLAISQTQTVDYLIIFDNAPLLRAYLEPFSCFVFELFDSKLVFVHHDNIWSSFADHLAEQPPETREWLLPAWERVRDRSYHFCFEDANLCALKALGFERVYPILHGSALPYTSPPETYMFDLSFVGHVLPPSLLANHQYSHLPFFAQVATAYEARLQALDYEMEPTAIAYAARWEREGEPLQALVERSNYQYVISALSFTFRGAVLEHLAEVAPLNITGGDPSYLRGQPAMLRLDHPNLTYTPPSHASTSISVLYASAKINVNITGLQFDRAVVNRVIDVGAVGGFILTDWKQGLVALTTVSEAISYRTVDELKAKAAYYLAHPAERLAIAAQLHQDVQHHCRYEHLMAQILAVLQTVKCEEN